jgi:hypothetical protein
LTYFYLRLCLADNGCSGLLDLFLGFGFIILFAISFWLAFKATFRKRDPNKSKPEPIILTITLLTIIVLIIGKTFGEDFKGKRWIHAETNSDELERQFLTLRKNGTFRVVLGHVDWSCYFSGPYQVHGDTILLDKKVIDQTSSLLTTKYLLQDSLLIPINDMNTDSTKFREFIIKSKE